MCSLVNAPRRTAVTTAYTAVALEQARRAGRVVPLALSRLVPTRAQLLSPLLDHRAGRAVHLAPRWLVPTRAQLVLARRRAAAATASAAARCRVHHALPKLCIDSLAGALGLASVAPAAAVASRPVPGYSLCTAYAVRTMHCRSRALMPSPQPLGSRQLPPPQQWCRYVRVRPRPGTAE